jgi:hypothetical protein
MMKKFTKFILLSVGLLFVSGCATHEKFVQKYEGWKGRNINMLITTIGYPDSTFTLPNNHKVYVYERSRIYSVPSGPMFVGYGYYRYGMIGYSHQVVSETCKIFFETDKKGTIVKWSARGNHCVSN